MAGAVLVLENVEAAVRGLFEMSSGVQKAAARGLYQFADGVVMTESKERYVPWEEGILRDSGFVELPQVERDTISVLMGFGGAAQDYARVQHEDLSFNHPRGGGAKYLEKPMLANAPRLPGFIRDEVNDEIARGGRR